VLYDLAFLLMDLDHRGHRALANLTLNRYLDLTSEDDGLGALPAFMALRAVIRAHVTRPRPNTAGARAIGRRLCQAAPLCRRGRSVLRPAPPRLIAIGGLSGSGKSTLALRLAPELGVPPGARVLRSDVLRKRRFGVMPEAPLPSEAYSVEVTALVYRELCERAATALDAGYAAVIDAVALRAGERRAFADVAAAAGAPFTGLWLDAPAATMRARIGARRGDASDASVDVLDRQLRTTPARSIGSASMRAAAREQTLENARRVLDYPSPAVREREGPTPRRGGVRVSRPLTPSPASGCALGTLSRGAGEGLTARLRRVQLEVFDRVVGPDLALFVFRHVGVDLVDDGA